MVEGSLPQSLDRIEAAMARIEAASLAQAASAPTPSDTSRDADLEQRHAALKVAVGQALTRIDSLIAEHG